MRRYIFVYLFKSPVSLKEVLLTCLVIFPNKSVQFSFVFTFRAIRPKLTSEFRVELDYMWVFPLHHRDLSKRT